MQKRQKIRLVTCFYNPAVLDPESMVVTEDALSAVIETWLAHGGLVRISYQEAALMPLILDPQDGAQDGPPPPEWLGLVFVPVQPVVEEAFDMAILPLEEEAHAY